MSNRIELENKADYDRTLEIERQVMRETDWKPPEQTSFVTYPAPDLADRIRGRLREENISYQ